ncbi:NAD-P-binding protein [Earliella scabrosa]|nr:NAD-P-binding protein [Earliella scabrosa]
MLDSAFPKVVLITGCSDGGIGSALATEFASKGCKVYATSRRLESMQELTHSNIERVPMDVTDDASVQAAVGQIVQKEGRIDILVNNAGMTCSGPVIDINMDRIQQTFDTNVFGMIRTCRAVIPHMAARKSGAIINIGSLVGEFPSPFAGIYSASKAALHSLSDALYMECTPFNISVVLITSGGARSNIIKNMNEHWTVPSTTLYTDYIDVIRDMFDPVHALKVTPIDEYARELVARTLKSSPPRHIVMGYGTTLFNFLKWLPRGFLYRLLWDRNVEKRRVELAKSK